MPVALQPAPTTENEVFVNIFDYIDRLFSIVRPRRVLFMAIGEQLNTTRTAKDLQGRLARRVQGCGCYGACQEVESRADGGRNGYRRRWREGVAGVTCGSAP